ncbi:MAG TPA: DUF5683 domain-containing protein [Longimicrobiales bacterium]|nr:DUF5683 domain-containing protein [Longimicrobiales bacterium]
MLIRLTLRAACLAVLFVAAPAAAQDPQDPVQDPVLEPDTMPVADTIPREFPTPRAAFMRAVAIPGWGHVYAGEYTRGAVYFALQSTSWFMLVKTLLKLDDVQDRNERLTGLAVDSLAMVMAADTLLAEQLEDPEAYEDALLGYPGLADTRSLVSARKQQRQDWITYTLFFTFAAGVDAYVTAHLKDFPVEIIAEPGFDGRLDLGFGIPTGGGH